MSFTRTGFHWAAKAEGKSVAGILDMRSIVPDSDPPHWLIYLEVDDVDRCVAEIESHDGTTVRHYSTSPISGASLIVADATGAFIACGTSKR